MSFSPGRAIGILAGAVAILAVGVYGPAMLLGPLPKAEIQRTTTDAPAEASVALALPADGASAAVLLGSDAPTTVATGGDPAPLPIGAAAKLVTVLVTVDALPLKDGDVGAQLTIGPEDYTDYLRYAADDSRTLPVSPGEKWSERDVVRAVLIASSNNHADTLARWAFGSVDAYVERANAWLAEAGFETLRIDDATGLSGDSVGSAGEVARLAALVLGNPALASIYDPTATVTGERDVPDVVDHAADAGARALARGYTDQAGLVFVYRTDAEIEGADAPVELVVAMVRMPDYETLDPAVAALDASVAAAAVPTQVIAAGAAYATVSSPWGDEGELVAVSDRTASEWGAAPGTPELEVEAFSTAPSGAKLGRVTVPVAGTELSSVLELDGEIRDPGPLWRVTNPAAIIAAFFANQQSQD